jgi:hypothetical protein
LVVVVVVMAGRGDVLKYCRHEEEKKKNPKGLRRIGLLYRGIVGLGESRLRQMENSDLGPATFFCQPHFATGRVQWVSRRLEQMASRLNEDSANN